jgi:hypothetical protein
MNKALFAIAGVVLTGGIVGMSLLGGDEPKEEEVKVGVQSTETASETTVNPPTERTVSVTGYPWEGLGSDVIEQHQANGEVVYLFSDAEAIEDTISEFAVSEELEGAPISKADSGKSWVKYLDGFIQGTQKYYQDKTEYFLKLEEIKADLDSGNFEVIPGKIEIAKTLR